MLERVVGRFRKRTPPKHGVKRRVQTVPPPPPPIRSTSAPPPPPPPLAPAGPEAGPRLRIMFDDGSVATSLDDPEQQAELGYILKNLLPPS